MYVHCEDRHMQARCKIHYCNTCKKGFAAWNPDSMKFWPLCVQKQLYRQVCIGRKSMLARTLVQAYHISQWAQAQEEGGHLRMV